MHLLVSSVHSGLDGIITLEISLGDVNYSYCHVTENKKRELFSE